MSTREEQLLREVEVILAETRRDAERVARDDAERDEHRAAAARAGQLGPDWRAVQRRIDAGQTSLAEVFGGGDESSAAVRLRARSRATMEVMAEQFDPPEELAAEIATARASLPGEPS
jgi:hypothetical protein